MSWTAIQANDHIGLRGFFSFLETKKSLGFFFPGEVHNFWECLYIRSGRATVFADDRIYDVSDGTMVFHKPMELHKYKVTSPEGAGIFTFSFFANGDLMPFFEQKVFKLTQKQSALLDSAFDMLRECYPDAQPNDRGTVFYNNYFSDDSPAVQMLTHYVSLLFLSISKDAYVCISSKPESTKIFSRAVSYMSSNLQEDLSVDDIAAFCNVSSSTLKGIFASQIGIGVHKYLLTLRIKKAISLLCDGVSITETADRLGFCNQGYFSAAFKRETGFSPSEFKHRSSPYFSSASDGAPN